jgi:hypothetical protein
MKKLLTIPALLLVVLLSSAQKQQYRVVVTGFYNVENLFDTLDNPRINDEEFLPASARRYDSRIYWDKIGRLSTVLSQMGTDWNPDGAALIGLAEIENDTVIKDLISSDLLKSRKLRYVHYDSPDQRGIDVGMIYNPKYINILYSAPLFVQLPGGAKDAYFTRDVLYVKALMAGGDTIHVFVNHWPSRSGGEERSAPGRAAAAGVVKLKVDSLNAISPGAKILIMGDLNDDPVSPSITKVLEAKGKAEDLKPGGIFNPYWDFYKRGIGTSPYQDAWGLFDQILVSEGWMNKEQKGFFYHKAFIFNKEYLVQKTGKYRSYTKRTWDGITYNYGYSDHFPVYTVMLRKAD